MYSSIPMVQEVVKIYVHNTFFRFICGPLIIIKHVSPIRKTVHHKTLK